MISRKQDLHYVLACLHQGTDASVVGISNIGKSELLRSLVEFGQLNWSGCAAAPLFVYVDCNGMLAMTDQGFYELILRALMESLQQQGSAGTVLEALEAAYRKVVEPSTPFQIALGFNEAMVALLENDRVNLVLLLDEFDEPLAEMPGRVFLNLRSLKDRYRSALCYVTATNRRLSRVRMEHEVLEFGELFSLHTRFLGPLDREDSWHFVQEFARREGVTFDENDFEFIYAQSGGHSGLMEVACQVLGEVTGKPLRDDSQDRLIHREVRDRLAQTAAVQAECGRIWSNLSAVDQDAMVALIAPGRQPTDDMLRTLRLKQVVVTDGDEPRLFCQLFQDFVRRQYLARREPQEGLQVDVDAGEVWVDGQQVPTLTNLEFRLLLLLFGRMGKICDKYEIVEAVWGQEYIDEVDDARIEKLVSRLRQKLEPDPSNPKYLITVRGRGYRLVTA